MLIDWFTVGAQALNFVILVWLMKRFLYKPILGAIAAREKKIAAELADADGKRAEAKKERDEFEQKNEALEKQRAALMKQAADDAKAERQRLLEEARSAADALSAKRMESLRNDANTLNQAIGLRVEQEVFAIARKALADLATTSLEERFGEVFTRRLREMGGPAKADLGKALGTSSEPALVRSAIELPADQRAVIQNALNETFSADVHLRFETAPELVGGIDLIANGQKLGWSIASYITSLKRGVSELLSEDAKAKAQADAKPEAKKEAKAGAKPEVKADAKPDAKPDAKADAKPDVKADAKPEVKADAKPEVTADAKPEAKPVATPEVKTEVKTVAKHP